MTDLETERVRSADSAGDLGAALRAFNRFELKYLVDRDLAGRLRDELGERLERDRHAPTGGYPVWSLYLDSPDLRCYWDKIEGIRVRRKLRIRHYGTPDRLGSETPVWLEVKQRVNRVTQKRRARLAYRDALAVAGGGEPESCASRDVHLVEEVRAMVAGQRLRPSTITGYVREAFVGRDEESGLRVTIDSRVRGRDRDLDLSVAAENRLIVRPDLVVVEVKVNERVPTWLTDRVARFDMQVIRISKYCQSIEAFGRAPRSVFHAPEPTHGWAPMSTGTERIVATP